jgi:nucleoside-diphosphate-sugar epimerase
VIDKDPDHLRMINQYGVKTEQADLSEKGPWYGLFSGQDVVIHLAAQISSPVEEDFQKNNIRATEHIIEAAKTAGVPRILFFSSAAVFLELTTITPLFLSPSTTFTTRRTVASRTMIISGSVIPALIRMGFCVLILVKAVTGAPRRSGPKDGNA